MGKHERVDSSKERVARRRAALRARGLRPKQFWLPDVTSPEFIAQAQADAEAVAGSQETREVQEWLNSIIDDYWSTWDD